MLCCHPTFYHLNTRPINIIEEKRREESRSDIHMIKVCKGASIFTHILLYLFTLIFNFAELKNKITIFKKINEDGEDASGQSLH